MDEEWNMVYSMTPEVGVLVLIFRIDREKYNIAKYEETIDDDHPNGIWVTQHGICFPVNTGDYWLEFPYISLEKLYDR